MTHTLDVDIELTDIQYAVLTLLCAQDKQNQDEFIKMCIMEELAARAEYLFATEQYDIRKLVYPEMYQK